jgi:hypothetical protein
MRRRPLEQVSADLDNDRAERQGLPRSNVGSNRNQRNDSRWRSDVMEKRGHRCRACGGDRDVQSDHLIPRSQGGPSIVENGTPLCGPFGRGCHDRKTAHLLLVKREWLDSDQVAWLELAGHAIWLPDGTVAGRHNVLFAAANDTEVGR